MTINETLLPESVVEELALELCLSSPVGPQPDSIPSCELFEYAAEFGEIIAAGAVAGFYGPKFQTMKFYREALSGQISGDDIAELKTLRSRLSSSRYDGVPD